MSIYYSILYFFVYGFLGWCTEVIFAAFKQHRFVNRGFLNGPICPIYGVGVTLVIACLEAFQSNLLLLYISSVILVTVLEGVTGWAMDKLFHNKWWDYSKLPFNIGGYVCLLFSLIWGVACVFIVYFVHPLIHQVLSLIPHTAGIALIAILGIALLSDMIVTTSAIVKFNQYLELLKHITDELHAISNQIGSELYQNVMHVLDMQESSRQKLDDVKLEVSEEIRMQIVELKTRAQNLGEKVPKPARRLLKAFPKLESRNYKAQLELFRQKLEQHLKNGKEVSDVPAYLQSLYRASVQPYLISWFKYNPRTVIASVKVPVLIVQGKNDIQVSVEDAELLKKGCPAAELLLIDKMNHVLKDCESKAVQQQMLTYGNPSLPVNSTLIASVSTFVKKLK